MTADPELKAAYEDLEAVVRRVSELEGFEGVLAEWVILTSHQRYDDEGDAVTQNGKLLPGGRVPHHRLMGLLDFELARLRAQAAED